MIFLEVISLYQVLISVYLEEKQMCPREKIKACKKGRTSKGGDVKKVALEEECKDALGR